MATYDDDQVLNLKKKKEKNKTLWRSRQRYKWGFCFAGQDAIECVIGFRIDGRTIKSGALIGQFGHLVPLDVGSLCICV